MAEFDEEEELLRSSALQNARAINVARHRAERELAKEREMLQITLASIGDGVISTDVEGRVTFLNGVAESADRAGPQAEAAGLPLVRGLSYRAMSTLVSRPKIRRCGPCVTGGRRAGEPYGAHRARRPGAADRRQRRADPQTRTGRSVGGDPGVSRRHGAQARRVGTGSSPSSRS
jgi:hypothetical protein